MQVFAVHKAGHLVPIELWVRQVTGESRDVTFLGIMRKTVEQGTEYMLMNPSFHVTFITEGIEAIFGIAVSELGGGATVSIDRFIRDFHANRDVFLSPAGVRIRKNVDGMSMDVIMNMTSLDIEGERVHVCRVVTQLSDLQNSDNDGALSPGIDLTKKLEKMGRISA